MPKLEPSRWTMIRELIVFQVKLAGDALRDLLLSPVSFACTFFDIIKGNTQDKSYFNRLMSFGKQTDIWLNLFGQHSNDSANSQVKVTTEDGSNTSLDGSSNNVDQLIAKIEALVVEQHATGNFSTNAKIKLSHYLKRLGNKDIESRDVDIDQN